MSRSQRDKGARRERELVAKHLELGGLSQTVKRKIDHDYENIDETENATPDPQ